MAKRSDEKLCEEVRSIVSTVDWPCDVRHNFSENNLGPKRRVESGLDWVFGQVDSAIILEDDCKPHPDFFHFCDVLLKRYEHDERVAAITGNNFQRGSRRGFSSYYFSNYVHIWGWATWSRSWAKYDADIGFWQDWKNSKEWRLKIPDNVERCYWSKIFNGVGSGDGDTWDYPFLASIWKNGGLTATPNVNLVTNTGFDEFATHTKSSSSWLAGIPTQTLGEIRHPDLVEQNLQADRFVFDEVFGGRNLRFPGVVWFILRKTSNFIRKRLGKNETA